MNILLTAIIEGVATRRDKTLRVTIGSNELSPQEAAKLLSMQNSHVFVYIKDNEVTEADIQGINDTDLSEGKTQSQRIRNSLYVLWKLNNEGFTEFKDFYQNKTEHIINHIKNKIKENEELN